MRVRTSFKKNKYKLIFLISLLILGFISGCLYYFFQSKGMKEVLINSLEINNDFNGKVNNLFTHILILPCLVFLICLIIGLPLTLFYLFYEGLSMGFSLCLVVRVFKLKGLWMIFKYFCLFKLFYLPLYILFALKGLDCVRNVIGLIIYKKEERIKRNLINNLKKLILFMIFILILDGIIYVISPFIFKYLI